MLDACILGAGPAGLSAALWLHNLGLRPAIFDCTQQPGGAQRLNFLTNDWVLGIGGLTGPQLSDRFVSHVQSLAVPLEMAAEPITLTRRPNGFGVGFRVPGATREVTARALLIATGTHYRGSEVLAGVEGFEQVAERWFAFGPYAFADLERCRGQRILIVGGGDNAFENARRLIGIATAITVVVRSRPRAQAQLVAALRDRQVRGTSKILEGAVVEAIRVQPTGLHVILGGNEPGRTVDCDRIHVLAGYEPNTTFLAALTGGAGLPPIALDADGYIVVDERMGTSCPGIYAAGDVCNRKFPSVVSAIGQGAVAAKAIEADLAP